jgi:hypothetical protein
VGDVDIEEKAGYGVVLETSGVNEGDSPGLEIRIEKRKLSKKTFWGLVLDTRNGYTI